jgi:hypothetical protein
MIQGDTPLKQRISNLTQYPRAEPRMTLELSIELEKCNDGGIPLFLATINLILGEVNFDE